MKKIRKEFLVEILIGIFVVVILIIAFNIIVKNNKPNNTFKSFMAFGQEIEYEENKHFYFLHMKKADSLTKDGSCSNNPFTINTYDNQGYNALSRFVNGENYAYYYFNLEGSKAYNLYIEDGYSFDLTGFDYGIYVFFDEPITIKEGC